MAYIQERKNKKRFIGNTLNKPHVLLKRKFLKDTSTDSEVLAGGK